MHTRGGTSVLCTPHPSHACVRQRTGRGSGTASPERPRGHPANTQSDRPAKCGHMSGGGASGPAGPPAPAPPSIAPLTASVAIVDEAFLCLLPPASKLASASASALVSAVHLRDVPRFLSGRHAALTPEGVGDEGALFHGGGGGGGGGEEGGTCPTDVGALVTEVLVPLPPPPAAASSSSSASALVRRPVREGTGRAHVDCGDGVAVVHCRPSAAATAAATSSAPGGGEDGGGRHTTLRGGTGPVDLLHVGAGGAGTLVADFCGVGGLDQVLFLPPLSGRARPAATAATAADGGDCRDPSFLAGVLAGSALSDGTSVVLPRSRRGACLALGRSPRGTPTLVLPPTDPVAHWDATSSGTGAAAAAAPSPPPPVPQESQKDPRSDPRSDPGQEQPWRAKLASALVDRLGSEARASKRRREDVEARRELARRSRRALESSGGRGTPGPTAEMVRIKYGTSPLYRSGSGTGSGTGSGDGALAVGLMACIDVICVGSRQSDAEEEGLEGLHLSFSPARSTSSSGWCIDSISVRSASGTAPLLRLGECVSIMASVDVEGLRWAGKGGIATSGDFELSVNCHWKNSRETKNGSVLGLLRLPQETVILPSFSSSGGHPWGITHEIDFSKGRNKIGSQGPAPSAILEYREPRVLLLDVSRCVGGADGECLRPLVDAANKALSRSGGRNRIELCYTEVEASREGQVQELKKHHPRLVVLAHSPEERLELVRLLVKNLPEAARIAGTTVGGQIDPEQVQASAVRALLLSMAEEIKLMDRHRRLQAEGLRLDTVGDLAVAQAHTDEAASKIKTGDGMGVVL